MLSKVQSCILKLDLELEFEETEDNVTNVNVWHGEHYLGNMEFTLEELLTLFPDHILEKVYKEHAKKQD